MTTAQTHIHTQAQRWLDEADALLTQLTNNKGYNPKKYLDTAKHIAGASLRAWLSIEDHPEYGDTWTSHLQAMRHDTNQHPDAAHAAGYLLDAEQKLGNNRALGNVLSLGIDDEERRAIYLCADLLLRYGKWLVGEALTSRQL